MRIFVDLQACQTPGSKNRGIGRYSWDLLDAMLRNPQGHDIHILLKKDFEESFNGIVTHFRQWLPLENMHVWKGLPDAAEINEADHWRNHANEYLRDYIFRRFQPDVIHTASMFEGAQDNASAICIPHSSIVQATTLYDLIPYVYQDIYLKNEIHKRYYLRKLQALRNSDLLLAISEYSKKEAIDYLHYPEEKLVNISSAVSQKFHHASFSQEDIKRTLHHYRVDKPFIMYTGGMDYRKNIEGLIQGFGLLPENLREQYQLAIVCYLRAEDTHQLLAVAKQAGVRSDQLIFTGYVSDDELIHFYQACYLFAFPSWHEGFGLPALEAMCCGAPVIAANTTSLPEVLGNDEALFNPHDPQSISQKIREVLDKPAFRDSLIQKSKQRITQFSWEASAEKTLSAFEQAVARKTDAKVFSVSNHGMSHANDNASPLLNQRPEIAILIPNQACLANPKIATLIFYLPQFYQIHLFIKDAQKNQASYPELQANFPFKELDNYFKFHTRIQRTLVLAPDNYALQELSSNPLYAELHQAGILTTASELRKFYAHQPEFYRKALLADYEVTVAFSGRDAQAIDAPQSPLPQYFRHVNQSEHLLMLVDWDEETHYVNTVGKIYQHYESTLPSTSAHTQLENLAQQLYQIASHTSPTEQDLLQMSRLLSELTPTSKQKRILVDISVLNKTDSATDIQRVVKNTLHHLLKHSLSYQIVPVIMNEYGARIARRLTAQSYHMPLDNVDDEYTEWLPNDIFLGLGCNAEYFSRHESTLLEMRNAGVNIQFVIHDISPITQAQFFEDSLAHISKTWLRTITSYAHGFICSSNAVREELSQWVRREFPSCHAHIQFSYFYLGSDLQRASQHAAPLASKSMSDAKSRMRQFLMVGTAEPKKVHSFAIDVFEACWQKGLDVSLMIVGDIDAKTEIFTSRIKQHPEYKHRLFWKNKPSDTELTELYKTVDCVFMPSYVEGLGLPLIEAAFYGTPVMARDISVFREIANEHISYFPNDDEDKLGVVDCIANWIEKYDVKAHPESSKISFLNWQDSTQHLLRAIEAHTQKTLLPSSL